jgi:glutamine amidotransferase
MSGIVAVIDYGMGNLHSVASALEHVGADKVLVTHDADLIRQADRVVFPGVGAIRDCMAEIRRLKCDELLAQALTEQHVPVLAICVGLQALMTTSEEKNEVKQVTAHPLWQGIDDMSRFYFVHSYYVHARDRDLLAGSVQYGVAADAALARDNLFAVQFHPEKSSDAGLKLLKNFLEWNGQC